MADLVHRVGIKSSPEHVYRALTTIEGLAGWWTEHTRGVPEVGKTIEFQFHDPNGTTIGGFTMEVLKQEPSKRVQWTCRNGPEEWIGTTITFELKQENGFTIVLFAHRHWRESSELTAHCNTKWGMFLMSLKDLLETGSGHPAPRDIKIDDWN
jgi:uncharacterized protein YndB with AHSA1/START domain